MPPKSYETCNHFVTLTRKVRVLYNTLRPHSALGYRRPAPAALAPPVAALRSPTAPCEPQLAQRVF